MKKLDNYNNVKSRFHVYKSVIIMILTFNEDQVQSSNKQTKTQNNVSRCQWVQHSAAAHLYENVGYCNNKNVFSWVWIFYSSSVGAVEWNESVHLTWKSCWNKLYLCAWHWWKHLHLENLYRINRFFFFVLSCCNHSAENIMDIRIKWVRPVCVSCNVDVIYAECGLP